MADDKSNKAIEISRVRVVEAVTQLQEITHKELSEKEIQVIYDHIYSAIMDYNNER